MACETRLSAEKSAGQLAFHVALGQYGGSYRSERIRAASKGEISDKEDVREKLVQLGADVPEGLTADQLANLYSAWLEEMPADVDVVGVYVGEPDEHHCQQ